MNTNKIFADFLKIDTAFDDRFSINPITRDGCWEVMKYDSSWEWLMVVVEYIEGLKTPITNNPNLIGQFEDYEIHIQGKHVVIYRHGEITNEVSEVKGKTKIEAVYTACLEFINWYNKHRKQIKL